MIKAIFYKEWIKTRWMIVVSFLIASGFLFYLLLNLFRVIDLKGAVHIWDVMIQRDALFVDLFKYVPLFIGVILGITQYAPEMYHKCLKLTLHLPVSSTRIVMAMLGFGYTILLFLFGSCMMILYLGLSSILPLELTRHILLTASVWCLAGLAGYVLTAWITLEPTWKRRILNGIACFFLIRIFFLESAGEAYNHFLPTLIFFILCSSSFIFLSISRFKEGKQD